MKLAAIYLCFNGAEHIKESIDRIYPFVDEILLIVSFRNHRGVLFPTDNHDFYNSVANKDDKISFRVVHGDELTKRQEGIAWAKLMECSHFIFVDEDEMYNPSQFKAAKEVVKRCEPKSSCCIVRDYYKRPDLLAVDAPVYYVPFIQSTDGRISKGYPVKVDSTRGISCSPNELIIFDEYDLAMHHYGWIRQNIREKLFNSTSFRDENAPLRRQIADYFDNWEEGMDAWIYPNTKSRLIQVEPE